MVAKYILAFLVLFSFNLLAEEFNVDYQANRIFIKDKNLLANCSSQFGSEYKISDKTLKIIQTDTIFDKSYCECKFDLTYSFSGYGEFNKIQIYRKELIKYGYPENKEYLVYEKDINYTNFHKSSIFVEFNYKQSDCKTDLQNVSYSKDYELLSVIPDIKNSLIEIKFNLISTSKVNLIIYNMLGKEVKKINTGNLKKGINQITVYSEGLPNGLYIGKIISDKGKVATFKLLWQD